MAIRGAKMAIRAGAKLTFGGGKQIVGSTKAPGGGGGNKPIRKTKKKWRHFFLFFETVKILYFVGAPFEFSGRAPFKLVTPLLHTSFFCCSYLCACLTARYFKVTTVNICKVIFPVPGLCSTFACAKMLYRRLVDDVTEIVVLLDTSYFPGLCNLVVDSTNSLASAVVQFVPRAYCGKLNLAAIISEGLSTKLYQIARSKIKCFRK